jgi:hypothetical protein
MNFYIRCTFKWTFQVLRTYINENKDDWDMWTLYFKFWYNTPPGVTGFSPFELTFARQANLPLEIFKGKLEI